MGDALYGTASGRLKLHASSISFVHPVSDKEMTIEKQPASDFYL
jgi:23S rRNA-/tRNA-specific pseudouridylate synthase